MAATPPQVMQAPELAVLDALEATLNATIVALVAAEPGVASEPPPWWRPPPLSTLQAERLIRSAYRLGDEIARYRQLVAAAALHDERTLDADDIEDW